MTNSYYSRVGYNYGGSNIFTIPFDYIRQSDIHVFINDIETNNFVFNTASQIQVQDSLTSGDVITIQRHTPIDERDVVFTNTSILNKETQNLANEQVFYGLQEIKDYNEYATETAKNFAQIAGEKATSASESADNAAASAELARKWAVQMPDPVEGNKHSAKYYASLFAETGQVRSDFTETDSDMASYIVGRENIATKNDLANTIKNNLLNKITNCILEAPNGVLSFDGTDLSIHKGLRFLSANGENEDKTINNIDYTLSSDIKITHNGFPSTSTGKHKLFLSKRENDTNFVAAIRALPIQWREQIEIPFGVTDCTWYNPKDKIWRNIGISEGLNSWEKWNNVAIGEITLENGELISIDKIYNPVSLLTDCQRLSNFDECDYDKPVTIPYNTVFTAGYDGIVQVASTLNTAANVYDPASNINIVGLVGKNLTASNIVSVNKQYALQGQYTITIPAAGYYNVVVIGGGGYGASHINSMGYMSYASGGSGAGFVGELYLAAGDYTITVGGAGQASSIGSLVVAGQGGNGNYGANYALDPSGGAGGTLSVTGTTRNVALAANGNSGTASNGNVQQAGGASVYNGYGQGGAGNGDALSNGNTPPAGGFVSVIGYQTVSDMNGNLVYQHSLYTNWDSQGNTVRVVNTQSGRINLSRAEQIIFKTIEASGNNSIENYNAVFYPKKKEVE